MFQKFINETYHKMLTFSLVILLVINLRIQLLQASALQYQTLNGELPIVIGHRGASGVRPGHTLESYALAIEFGADFVEPDLIMTKDGFLVCRHEPMLSLTTNVADFPEFRDRKTTKKVDGINYTDWFAGDFTLEEIKKLRTVQNFSSRPKNYNYLFSVPTFEEVINLVKMKSEELGIKIGIYPETKRPTFHEQSNLPITDTLLDALSVAGWNNYEAPVYVQSFEVSNLQYIRELSTVKTIQLISASGVSKEGKILAKGLGGKPYDFVVKKDKRTYADLITEEGLDFIGSYADGIAVYKPYIIPYTIIDSNNDGKADDLNGDGKIDSRDFVKLPATDLVIRAHNKDLLVHVWSVKNELSTLLHDYNGDSLEEYKDFYNLGVDGVFSDFPDSALVARDLFMGV